MRSTRMALGSWSASRDKPFELQEHDLAPVRLYPVGAPHPPITGAADGSLGPFPLKACPYCEGSLQYAPEVSELEKIEWCRADAVQCQHCRWWIYVWTKAKFYPDEYVKNVIFEASVCEFDYAEAKEPLVALREQITAGSMDLRDLTPRGLERMVTSVFRDATGGTARHVGCSGDGGVDVLVVDGPTPLAIQVKRREGSKNEGPAVIRDLVGALAYRGLRRGAVVTTAKTFTSQARETADAAPLHRDGYEISLYAYDALRDLVQATTPPERPWLDLIYGHYLSGADRVEAERRVANSGRAHSPGPWL
jgi:hypothetical protein